MLCFFFFFYVTLILETLQSEVDKRGKNSFKSSELLRRCSNSVCLCRTRGRTPRRSQTFLVARCWLSHSEVTDPDAVSPPKVHLLFEPVGFLLL